MDIRELGRLDLNLLVALEALLEERSVSRAAERLFVTQSAMSKTLGRLRELFDDQLFVRQGGSMVPTPRATQLAEKLPEVLLAVQAMVQPLAFDPATYRGEMTVLVQGYMGAWFLPALLARIRESAPDLRVTAIARDAAPFEKLASGALDFALQIERLTYPPELELTTLAFAQPALLARKGHPLEDRNFGIDDVVAFPQVSLLSTDIAETRFHEGDASLVLEYERRMTPHYQTDDLQIAMEIVRNSDCLFPAPPLFIEQFNLSRYVVALPVPGLENVSIKYVAVRHERVIGSPPHDFFYDQIVATTEAFRARFGLPNLADLRAQRDLSY